MQIYYYQPFDCPYGHKHKDGTSRQCLNDCREWVSCGIELVKLYLPPPSPEPIGEPSKIEGREK